MKIPKSSQTLFFLMLTFGCTTSERSIASLNDEQYFNEAPKIVIYENRYFLRFQYSDKNNAWGFYMFIHSKFKKDSLIFYLPATTSSGSMRGRIQFQEITSGKELKAIIENNFFWEEPDGGFRKMNKENLKEEEIR
jgi:hypothetical protein